MAGHNKKGAAADTPRKYPAWANTERRYSRLLKMITFMRECGMSDMDIREELGIHAAGWAAWIPPRDKTKYEWGEDVRKVVRRCAFLGLTNRQIAAKLMIPVETLQQRLGEELAAGRADGVETYAMRLDDMAANGNDKAVMFYLKTKGDFSEKREEAKTSVKVSVGLNGRRIDSSGKMVEVEMSGGDSYVSDEDDDD